MGLWGQRPGELALALLLEECPRPLAVRRYQEFKRDVIAGLDRTCWTLCTDQILAWLYVREPLLKCWQCGKMVRYVEATEADKIMLAAGWMETEASCRDCAASILELERAAAEEESLAQSRQGAKE